jgi:hypothetical protein
MSQLNRRQLLHNLGAAGSLSTLAPEALLAATADRERIRAENEQDGTTDWQLTYTRIDPKTKCTRFGGGLGWALWSASAAEKKRCRDAFASLLSPLTHRHP